MVELYRQRKTELLSINPVPVPLCPPQVSLLLTWPATNCLTYGTTQSVQQELLHDEILITMQYYNSACCFVWLGNLVSHRTGKQKETTYRRCMWHAREINNAYNILGGKLEKLGLLRTARLRWEINTRKHRKIN